LLLFFRAIFSALILFSLLALLRTPPACLV
jgi:hypothetical protein